MINKYKLKYFIYSKNNNRNTHIILKFCTIQFDFNVKDYVKRYKYSTDLRYKFMRSLKYILYTLEESNEDIIHIRTEDCQDYFRMNLTFNKKYREIFINIMNEYITIFDSLEDDVLLFDPNEL